MRQLAGSDIARCSCAIDSRGVSRTVSNHPDEWPDAATVLVWAVVAAAVVFGAYLVVVFSCQPAAGSGAQDPELKCWLPPAVTATFVSLWYGHRLHILDLALVSIPAQAALWMLTIGPW